VERVKRVLVVGACGVCAFGGVLGGDWSLGEWG